MRQQYQRKKRAKHRHGCKLCNETYKCTDVLCRDADNSVVDECALCGIRSPAFQEALKASHEEIRDEMELSKVCILSVYEKNKTAGDTHIIDHVFRRKQEAINYFEVHYEPLKYRYIIDWTDTRF